MNPVRCAIGLVALATLLTAGASAQPSIWDEARDPNQRTAYRALLVAEAAVEQASDAGFGSTLRRRFSELGVRTLAPHLHGSDPRVRFLWAELLSRLGQAWDREIIETLRPALLEADDAALYGDGPSQLALDHTADASLVGDGWYVLALAAARLGDRELERSAYDEAMELEWHPAHRANILYNRADAKLGLVRLSEALADYRAAAGLSPDPDLQALSYYGQGITLERMGDLPSALSAIQMAIRLQPAGAIVSVLDRPSVFFVPEYDIHYYKALEAMARVARYDVAGQRGELAHEAAEDRRDQLNRAVNHWHLFLMAAAPHRDRWVPNAERHLDTCERALESADEPVAKPKRRRRGRR